MSLPWNKQITFALGIAPFALLLMLAGCNRGAQSTDSNGGAAQVASGAALFQSNGCGRCHSLNGQGGGRAPDLSHEGADPQHSAQWIAQHIKNPQSQNPQSRMPAFEGRMSEQDIQTLGSYLASLK